MKRTFLKFVISFQSQEDEVKIESMDCFLYYVNQTVFRKVYKDIYIVKYIFGFLIYFDILCIR